MPIWAHAQSRTYIDLYAEFDCASISGWFGFVASVRRRRLSLLCCKIQVVDTCTSPQRFVSSLYYMVHVRVFVCVYCAVRVCVCGEGRQR